MNFIFSQFQKSVENFANRPAICYDSTTQTYSELSKRVSQIADLINNQINDSKQVPIGIYLSRSSNLIASLLAVAKTGHFYVPLDPNAPEERLKMIVEDIQPHLILTNLETPAFLNSFQLIHLKDLSIKSTTKKIDGNCKELDESIKSTTRKIDGDCKESSYQELGELIYVIYTSGTTGKPKGVQITHTGLLNLIQGAIRILNVNEKSRIFNYTSIGFDAAGWDIYLALFSGGCLHIAKEEMTKDSKACFEYIDRVGITLATVTPAFLANWPLSINKSTNLQTLVVMGDLADAKNLDFWCRHVKVYNGYGPTETTIGATLHQYLPGDSAQNIGQPFDNYTIQIIDGELCIGGPGVAVGYWNLPELTAQKFVQTEFGRFYRTGDLAEIKENGDIYFIGRKDNQVKINGVRIELEEIESHLLEMPAIQRACLKFDSHLTVYYTINSKVTPTEIRTHLSRYLLQSVIPSRYVQMDSFVLNSSGKIDKKALPEYVIPAPIFPVTQVEKDVVASFMILGYDQIGLNTNMYEIGCNSLQVYKVKEELTNRGYKVPISLIMNFPVLGDLAHSLTEFKLWQNSVDSSDSEIVLKRTASSPYHESLLSYLEFHPTSTAYNLPIVIELSGEIDEQRMVKALNQLVCEISAFRTVFKPNLRTMPKDLAEKIQWVQLYVKSESEISEIVRRIYSEPFKIDGFLFRIWFFRVQETGKYILAIVKHDLITDSYSENLIKEKLTALYLNQEIREEFDYLTAISALDLQFAQNAEKDRRYWQARLKGAVQSNLPVIFDNKDAKNSKNGKIVQSFSIKGIGLIAQLLQTTPALLLFSLFQLMIYRITENPDVIVGFQVAQRTLKECKETVGFMVATLLHRSGINRNFSLFEFVREIQNTFYTDLDRSAVTYSELTNLLGFSPEIMYVSQDFHPSSYLDLPGITSRIITSEILTGYTDEAPFPQTWNVGFNAINETVKIELLYQSQYSPWQLQQYLQVFQNLLQSTVRSKMGAIISELSYLNESKIQGINQEVEEISLYEQFHCVVQNSPDSVALLHSTGDYDGLNEKVSYSELESTVSRWSAVLIDHYHVKVGDRVAVLIQRGCDFVTLILAILKAGACYIPVDPDYPDERHALMLEDCSPQLIIARKNFRSFRESYVSLETIQDLAETQEILYADRSSPNSLTYIIYTSGSTGKPKGCQIGSKAIRNMLQSFQNELEITRSDRIWSLTTISFDILVLEVFLPLVSGATLCICPPCVAIDPIRLSNWINQEAPTLIQATPTQYSLIVDHLKLPNNTKILVGGEALPDKLFSKLKTVTPLIYNVYGPSETTVWSTCSLLEDEVTIGYPIANTICQIVNKYGERVVPGSVGELLIGGDGLSDGYYQKPELTNQKFIEAFGQKYYRTGDLVKESEIGIIYCGREDFQVKIRGRRIELGDISSTLEKHPQIKRAIVAPVLDLEDNLVLVGYYISETEVPVNELFGLLQSSLPKFMVPKHLLRLPRFPETLNGKADLKSLPSPFITSDESWNFSQPRFTEVVAPRNELEQSIADIWKRYLKIDQVSVFEPFLNYGGDSTNIFKIRDELEKLFDCSLDIVKLFQATTIAETAKLVK